MSRLGRRFADLHAGGRKALVAYIVAGDPGAGATVPLMHALVAAGADAIELGVPFSDPEAEGPVIQKAHERALAAGMTLRKTIGLVADFRREDQETPVVLMGYLNPIEAMGYEAFASTARAAGADGTILVNMPPEEAADLGAQLTAHELDSVYLLAPTTTDERARFVCEQSQGFVYYVSLKGTTGAGTLDVTSARARLAEITSMTEKPVVVGFGIKDYATAVAMGPTASGVAVGTAIVNEMATHGHDSAMMQSSVSKLIAEIRKGLDQHNA